ncbi:MAG: DNA polymerase III subunit gamma/tau [Terracidiphilus sp.]
MAYQVLARKYRPQRFADVAGQDHVTRTLLNALNQNRIAHGYIFSGHRGIGKTTIARILAMALNCRTEIGSAQRPTPEPCGVCDSCTEIRQGNAVDVIEIDAATNRGIDEIRELRDAARYSPARDRYKIYILDEAHQITDAAFNALLKTLEEPPAHVIFMMATTQPEDIPQTIRSRCQHFSFHAVRFDDILAQLKAIAAQEQVESEDAALALLAEAGDGSMRDALSIMDQAIASAPCDSGRPILSTAQIRELMGSVPNTVFEKLLEAVAAGQSAELMEQLNLLINAGHSPQSLARQMVRYLRNTLMAKIGGEQTELLEISTDERARAARTALLFTEEELTRNLQIVLRAFDDLNYRQEQRFHLELAMLKLIHAQRLLPIEELLSGVAQSGGVRTAAPVPTSRTATAARPAANSTTAPPAPAHSPFGPSGSSWNDPGARTQRAPAATATRAESQQPIASAVLPEPIEVLPAVTPFSVESVIAPSNGTTEAATAGAAAKTPHPASAAGGPETSPGDGEIESLRQAVCAALDQAGHASAAQLLGAGVWSLDGAMVRIEVAAMGKKMMSLTVNAAAEKIIREALSRQSAPARFLIIPGEGDSSAARPAPPIAAAGSVQEAALANPMVQRAREILHAEVRSVVDLREK